MDYEKDYEKINEIEIKLSSPREIPKDELDILYDDANALLNNLQERKRKLKALYKKEALRVSELSGRLKDSKRYLSCRFLVSNAKVDSIERNKDPFAKGLSIYKIFLVFFFGAIIGDLVEVLWAFARFGQYQSRQGFIYGPFNPVYGFGAVFLTLFLYKYRNRAALSSFIGAMIIGSVLEYLLSFFQEKLFGSVSWDYSAVPLNVDGRICLPYAVLWGILGVVWIKGIYPIISYWIMKIPKNLGKTISIILFVFMAFDAGVSLFAVNRWSERINGIDAKNKLEMFVDSKYPDERMEHIYPNMVFGEKDKPGE